jgi:hypothetical protein
MSSVKRVYHPQGKGKGIRVVLNAEGYRAAIKGSMAASDPYQPKSLESMAWQEGWLRGQAALALHQIEDGQSVQNQDW